MFRRSLIATVLLFLFAFIAACAPTPPPDVASTAPTPSPKSVTLDDFVASGESTQSSFDEESLASEAGTAELDSALSDLDEPVAENGIPMGFTDDGHPYMGDLSAPVVIEEFSDYQCPYCARFFTNTMPQLIEDSIRNGDAVLIFYDFPLNFHPQAADAANAARCAGEQGIENYWAMHDELFNHMALWSSANPIDAFMQLALDIGLAETDFRTCLEENRYGEAVLADLELGQSRGVTGTPTFFINDQPFVGAQPISAFAQAIDAVKRGASIVEEAPSPDDLDIPPFQMPEQTVLTDDYAAVLGDPDAPILIVELTDYECPFCSRHSLQTMPQILRELVDTGRVRYALKDFPLDQIHPDARTASVAARCAGEQDAYWEMHDLLFLQQAVWGQGNPEVMNVMRDFAADLGLDEQAFDGCLLSGQYTESIQTHVDEGFAAGVSGTPAFFIDGYFLSGAQPFEVFELIVDNLEADTIEQLFREAYDEQVRAYKEQVAQEQAAQQPAEPVDVPLGDAFAIGDPNAPIVIVEYTDFQCPYCGRHFAQTFPQIKENYIDTGLVRYVFKDFPLNFHTEADEAAQAARCAAEQDAFLDMHAYLFERQGEWSGQSDVNQVFVGYATDLNLDQPAFSDCLLSGKYADAVDADFNEGASFGVTGTPSFFVNGNPLFGALPYTSFAQAIDSLLGE